MFHSFTGLVFLLQLACARIGAVHSVVFAGFSAESLAGRILDSKPSVVLTASAVKRGAKPINLKVNHLSQWSCSDTATYPLAHVDHSLVGAQ